MKGLFLSSLSFTSFCAGHQKYDNMGGGGWDKELYPPLPPNNEKWQNKHG